jgi:hypothetical protein
MISIVSTPIHSGRCSPALVSNNNEFDEKCDDDFSFVSSSENCLSKRKTTRVPRRASEQAERPGCFEEKKCCSSECCEHESDLRTNYGIQVSDG